MPSRRGDRRPGIASSAWDRHVGSWTSTGRAKNAGADWSTPPPVYGTLPRFRGFGTPNTSGEHGDARHIRDLSVPVQEELIGRHRRRVEAENWPRTQKRLYEFGLNQPDATTFDASAYEDNDTLFRRTNTTAPERPRTVGAYYDSRSHTVYVRFRPQPEYPGGAIYEYYDVPPNIFRNLMRSASPGRYIDRVLDAYPYTRVEVRAGGATVPVGVFSVNPDANTDLYRNSAADLAGDYRQQLIQARIERERGNTL